MIEFDQDKKYLLNVYKRLPINIIKGKGSYLIDYKNNKYLDMFSGIAVNVLGYNNKLINKAIKKQIKKYLHLSNHFVNEESVNLAKLLVDNSFASKCFFSNSGTEANEAALKLARAYGKMIDKDKVEILTLTDSFHGRTYGGLSLTGQVKKKNKFTPVLDKISHVKRNDIEDLRSKVNNNTCAIFLELIQGESGINLLSQEFIDEVKRLSNEYIFLIIIDEVQTGLMRTGSLFAYEKFDVTPDVATLAKSVGGGLPLGAMLVSSKLENVLTYGDHGSTFGGNPLSCATGYVVLKELLKDDFIESIEDKSKYLIEELIKIKNEHSMIIKDVRGIGLMVGIDCDNYSSIIFEKMLAKKVLLNITNGKVIRLLPPLNISYSEIELFLYNLKETLIDIEAE